MVFLRRLDHAKGGPMMMKRRSDGDVMPNLVTPNGERSAQPPTPAQIRIGDGTSGNFGTETAQQMVISRYGEPTERLSDSDKCTINTFENTHRYLALLAR
jgi:hypothetical protein